MQDAFMKFAEGRFECGLKILSQNELWNDCKDSLDGPFYLGFPNAPGWGEGLLLASLLKRHTEQTKNRIKVFSSPALSSLLTMDDAFCVETTQGFGEAKSNGARPPLAILRNSLTGVLLNEDFKELDLGTECPKANRPSHLIGIAWASISDDRKILGKSIPLQNFLNIFEFENCDLKVFSFQRGLCDSECQLLRNRFGECCTILQSETLDAIDQRSVVREIRKLDLMVTVSTTTAHIAACLGVPVVLLTARRSHQQWFWRAQAEHSKLFYPNAEIVLGGSNESNWWEDCIKPANRKVVARLKTSCRGA